MIDPYLDVPRSTGPADAADARTLRQRQAAIDAAIDSAEGDRPPFVSARRLVQVYDGGDIPTDPEKVYFTHPVDLDGAEVEGGTATPVADTAVTIPVIVLHKAAVAGDILVATAVGGRWVAEKEGVPTLIVRVIGCAGLGVEGLTVKVYELDGTTVHFTGTTNSSGNVTVSGVSGTRRVKVTGSARFDTFDASVLFHAVTTITLTPATGYKCACCVDPFKTTLHATPALGTGTLLWTGSLWDSRGLSGTGYTLTPACLLSIYISGVLCQQLSAHTKDCPAKTLTFSTFFQNSIPCSFSAGTIITLSE